MKSLVLPYTDQEFWSQDVCGAAAECPRVAWKQRARISDGLEAGSPRSRPQQTQHLASETSFPLHRCHCLAVSSHGAGVSELSGSLCIRPPVLLTGAAPSRPSDTPAHRRLGFQRVNLGVGDTPKQHPVYCTGYKILVWKAFSYRKGWVDRGPFCRGFAIIFWLPA